ncbi:hypothetical protein Nepgr_017444 [Nepenthes gracilis]|uniref:Uncharacterized protein n=1 Tax=Nepenthes gracilis TaxID=150966 RepID=A0AAD3SPG1_NEPGR|nr:hypothetical protein Nepgr_017444 [Nepenthes gracilis]
MHRRLIEHRGVNLRAQYSIMAGRIGDVAVQFLMIVHAIEQKILVDLLSLLQLARSLVVAALAVNRRASRYEFDAAEQRLL